MARAPGAAVTKRKTLDERAYDYADKEWPPREADKKTKVKVSFAVGCGFDGARNGWLSGYQAAWRDMRRKFAKRRTSSPNEGPDAR